MEVHDRLLQDEVHLWWGRLDAVRALDAAQGSLSDEERRRGERFHREEDACAFVARRVFLRSVLARYVGTDPAKLVFASGRFGKPSLVDAGELVFNASCSGRWTLVGVTRGRALGVDVEGRRAQLADEEELSRLAQRVLGAREKEEWADIAPAERVAAFLRAWTRKEAWLKALGTGFSREPDTVDVGLSENVGVVAIADDAFPRGATLLDLPAPDGAAACVVAEGTGWRAVERGEHCASIRAA